MGLGFASMMDPQNGVQVPVVSQFYLILATLLFLVLNGHLILIDLLFQSFHTFPVAVDGLGRSSFADVVGWGSRLFSAGLLMALPVMAALLLVNLGMGIVTRAAPQLNIFAVGFGHHADRFRIDMGQSAQRGITSETFLDAGFALIRACFYNRVKHGCENQDGQEKTEEPTSKRLQDSRKKGQVAHARKS